MTIETEILSEIPHTPNITIDINSQGLKINIKCNNKINDTPQIRSENEIN